MAEHELFFQPIETSSASQDLLKININDPKSSSDGS